VAVLREAMSDMLQTAARLCKISMLVITMPWACLQAAVEQILQEPDDLKREKQLQEWQRLKNSELMNVSVIVRYLMRLDTFESTSIDVLIMTGHTHCVCRHRLHSMDHRWHRALGCVCILVLDSTAESCIRYASLLRKHPLVQLRNQHIWQQAASFCLA
jgi:hypothetical protein